MARNGKQAEPTNEQEMVPVLQDRPQYLANVQQGKARGSEEVGVTDLVIPRLEIIQALSPCRQKNDPLYIPGAEEGLVFNTVTRQLYTGTLLIVPVLFRKEYIIWKDRKQGGGFKGSFQDEISARQALEQLPPEDRNSCEVVDTAQHFCLLLNRQRESVEEVVVSMSRTKMKVSRQWNSLIRLAGDDRFARVYALETVPESNQKGSFYNWKVTPLGYAPEYAYRAGEALYESVKQGRVIEADRSVEVSDEPAASTEI